MIGRIVKIISPTHLYYRDRGIVIDRSGDLYLVDVDGDESLFKREEIEPCAPKVRAPSQRRVLAWLVGGLLAIAVCAFAFADQVCQSVYNPMTNQWEYQCVDRPDDRYQAPPVCHQEYDPMNNRWVTVCN